MLARELGDRATAQIAAELGIVVPPEADHPAAVSAELPEPGGRVEPSAPRRSGGVPRRPRVSRLES